MGIHEYVPVLMELATLLGPDTRRMGFRGGHLQVGCSVGNSIIIPQEEMIPKWGRWNYPKEVTAVWGRRGGAFPIRCFWFILIRECAKFNGPQLAWPISIGKRRVSRGRVSKSV